MENYFDIMGLPIQLNIDESALKKTFYTLSRKFHPDVYVDTDEGSSTSNLVKYELINQAYKVLSNKMNRIEHVLTLHDKLNTSVTSGIDPEFLSDMMDINLAIDDAKSSNDISTLQRYKDSIHLLQKENEQDLSNNMKDYDQSIDKSNALESLKINYLKNKYYLRISESLSTFASL